MPTIPSATSNLMASHKAALSMDMLDNFRPRDSRKDKKKKRHKEKSSNDDIKPSTTSINRPKDREERLLQQLRYDNQMTSTNIPGSIVNDHERLDNSLAADGISKAETEMQIYWLEKVYTLNKQLQKEEELAAKLHAKIRKHQLKKANQTQKEVQLEMDKLDHSLALQCGSIRRVEANLMETNEQLQKKLQLLERLSLEYLRQQEAEQAQKEDDVIVIKNEQEDQQNLANEKHLPLEDHTVEMPKISLTNLKSKEELEQLQKLISKPGFDMKSCAPMPMYAEEMPPTIPQRPQLTVTALMHHPPMDSNDSESHAPADSSTSGSLGNNERMNIISLSNKTSLIATASPKTQEPDKTAELTTSTDVVTHSLSHPMTTLNGNDVALSTRTISPTPVCTVLDKNMSTSLHVQNVKTIKKQMFHSQPTTLTTTIGATASAAGTTPTPSPLHPKTTAATTRPLSPPSSTVPNANPLAKALEVNTFSPKQQSQNFNQHMQLPHPLQIPFNLLPAVAVASSTCPPVANTSLQLKGWPSHSHHYPVIASRMMMPAEPGTVTAAVNASAALAPIHATMALPASAAVASSTSSPASLIAMNTVDISQLGTLV